MSLSSGTRYQTRIKEGGKIGVTLTASDNDRDQLVVILESALDRFTALLNERGIKIIWCSVDDAE